MEGDGGRVLRRGGRVNRLLVVVTLELVLVAVCMLVTLYVAYWDVQGLKEKWREDEVHIQFEMISDISANTTLQFNGVRSGKLMGLVEGDMSRIQVNCTGPYILYMYVCYMSLEQWVSGTLELQVVGSKAPVSTLSLNVAREACRGLQSIAYLRAHEDVTLGLYSTGRFKIKNLTMGLSYQLGKRCEF